MMCHISPIAAANEESSFEDPNMVTENTTDFYYIIFCISDLFEEIIKRRYINVFTITAISVTSLRLYFLLNHTISPKSNNLFILFFTLLFSADLAYEIINNWESNNNLVTSENIEGLFFFNFHRNLFPPSHVYHVLANFHDAEIIKMSIINIDRQTYAFVRYLKNGNYRFKLIKLLSEEKAKELCFIEVACVNILNIEDINITPISIFSNEVVEYIFADIFDDDSGVLNISKIEGVDYSISEEMLVSKLDLRNSSSSFSLCYRKIPKIEIREKPFPNSNETLINESIILFNEENDTFNLLSFGMEILINKIYNITLVLVSHISSHYVLRSNCPICLEPLSIFFSTICGYHWFCTSCLQNSVRFGVLKCPVCRQ